MANTWALSDIIADRMLTLKSSELAFPMTASKTVRLDVEFNDKEYRKGDSIQYRLQNNFDVGEGTVATVSDYVERSRPLTIDRQWNVTLQFTGRELTFDTPPAEDYFDQILLPRARNIAHKAEDYIGEKMQNEFYNSVGSPTAAISDITLLNQARALMNRLSIPDNGDRYCALNQSASISLANGTQNFFNSTVNNEALFKGALGNLATYDLFETVFLGTHTAGTGDGSAVSPAGTITAGTVVNAVTSGNTIDVTGLTASDPDAFKRGDVVTVAGVNAFNQITGRVVGPLRLVVLADAAASLLGAATITVSPEIHATGPYQNIDLGTGIPVGAQLSIYSDHDVSVAYHCDALVHAMPRLEMLGGNIREEYVNSSVAQSRSENKDYRISMLYTEGADVLNYQQVNRTDILQGATINGEYGVRIITAPTNT